MDDVLGLLAEGMQLATDLGYRVREEPLGDLPGGGCAIGGSRQILLNIEQPAAERLQRLLDVLAADPQVEAEPKSRVLAQLLKNRTVCTSGELASESSMTTPPLHRANRRRGDRTLAPPDLKR